MNSTSKAVAAVVAAGASLTVGLVILELVFGGWLRAPEGWQSTDQLNLIRDRTIFYDASGIYGDDATPIRYSRDSFGLRGSCARPADINVVTIGGSTTDQRYITDGETWQDVLQSEIRQRTGDGRFCVANAGVDGHSTYGHIDSLDKWFPLIPDFQPSHYLIYVGINDAGFRDAPSIFDRSSSWQANSALWGMARAVKSTWDSRGDNHLEKKYAGHSNSSISLNLFTEALPTPESAPLIQVNTTRFEGNMEHILQSIRQAGGTPVCVSQPHQLTQNVGGQRRGVAEAFTYNGKAFNGIDYDNSLKALNGVLQSVCGAYGGNFIDLHNTSLGPQHYYDYVHQTPDGARQIGLLLADELAVEWMPDLKGHSQPQ